MTFTDVATTHIVLPGQDSDFAAFVTTLTNGTNDTISFSHLAAPSGDGSGFVPITEAALFYGDASTASGSDFSGRTIGAIALCVYRVETQRPLAPTFRYTATLFVFDDQDVILGAYGVLSSGGTLGALAAAQLTTTLGPQDGPNPAVLFDDVFAPADALSSRFAASGGDFSRAVAYLADGNDDLLLAQVPGGTGGGFESQAFPGRDRSEMVVGDVEMYLAELTLDVPGSNPNGDGMWTDFQVALFYAFYEAKPAITTRSTTEPSDAGICPFGGNRVEYGLDDGAGGGTRLDRALQDGEVDGFVYACLGAPGVDPHNALVRLTTVSAGDGGCSSGGVAVAAGIDDGAGTGIPDDGTLADDEVDTTEYVCNAPPGTDGKDGVAGLDGVPGSAGTNGAAGKDGSAGTNGTDGKDGTRGGCQGIATSPLAATLALLLLRCRRPSSRP